MADEKKKGVPLPEIVNIMKIQGLLRLYGIKGWSYSVENGQFEKFTQALPNFMPVVEDTMTVKEAMRWIWKNVHAALERMDKDTEFIARQMGIHDPQWEVWVLSGSDIQCIWNRMRPDAEPLTEDQMEDVARLFEKGFRSANGMTWESDLKMAIENTDWYEEVDEDESEDV